MWRRRRSTGPARAACARARACRGWAERGAQGQLVRMGARVHEACAGSGHAGRWRRPLHAAVVVRCCSLLAARPLVRTASPQLPVLQLLLPPHWSQALSLQSGGQGGGWMEWIWMAGSVQQQHAAGCLQRAAAACCGRRTAVIVGMHRTVRRATRRACPRLSSCRGRRPTGSKHGATGAASDCCMQIRPNSRLCKRAGLMVPGRVQS